MSVPDLMGEVYGVRAWHPTEDGLPGWKPGPNAATCHSPTHVPPVSGCGCGFYAYYDTDCFRRLGNYGAVWGLVRAWGRIGVRRDGFRAQHAQVVALALDPQLAASKTASQVAALLAKDYAVPVVRAEELDDLVHAHGTVPKSLRPDARPAAPPHVVIASASAPVAHDPTRDVVAFIGGLWASCGALLSATTGGSLPLTLGLALAAAGGFSYAKWS